MTAGGKDKKKLMFLGGLGVVLAIVMYVNLFSGPSIPAQPAPDRRAAAERSAAGDEMAMEDAAPKTPATRPRVAPHGRTDEFHPVYLSNRPEERPDPSKIDPTLRLDLFAKVQDVDVSGGKRNLFAFGAPPPPKPVELPKGPETRVALAAPGAKGASGAPGASGTVKPADPAEVPLHTNLKYYGIVALSQGGRKTACFLDTDDQILLGTEGETLKRRYRVVTVGSGSAVLQDVESKRQETIPLAQEAKGS